MKIPPDATIPDEKLTRYLLLPRDEDDKSRFLAQAGFTQQNPRELETALRTLIREEDAVNDRINEYGVFYQVRGYLKGLNDVDLAVVTVWLQEARSGQYRFITLKPWR
jgi:hypothetical protein